VLNAVTGKWFTNIKCCRESRAIPQSLRSCPPDQDMCGHSFAKWNRNEKCHERAVDFFSRPYVCELGVKDVGSSNQTLRFGGAAVAVDVASGNQRPRDASGLTFAYTGRAAAPTITAVTMSRNGGTIQLHIVGNQFGTGISGATPPNKVLLGLSAVPSKCIACVVASWLATEIRCSVNGLTAGVWPVRVLDASGQSSAAVTITVDLQVNTVSLGGVSTAATGSSQTLNSGFGGELSLTIQGVGLAQDVSYTSVTVCGAACKVTHSNDTTTVCTTPPLITTHALSAIPGAYPIVNIAEAASPAAFYTDWSVLSNNAALAADVAAEKTLAGAVFKSRVDEAIRLAPEVREVRTRKTCSFSFDLAPHELGIVSSVALFPPTKDVDRPYAKFIDFQAFNETTEQWVTFANLDNALDTGASMQQGWNEVEVTTVVRARRFRLFHSRCIYHKRSGEELMRGARIRGYVVNAVGSDAGGQCPIALRRVRHALTVKSAEVPALTATITHTEAFTPVVTHMTPSYGTARGGTAVRLFGRKLDSTTTNDPLKAAASLNGYACTTAEARGSYVSCTTGGRSGAIKPQATYVWVAGRGRALIVPNAGGATSWEYLDRWSDHRTWLDSETPVDGDTVIVPEGEAVMLDVDTPKLFLLLVMGSLVFEDAQDLNMNSTYIWVAGGTFKVGTQAKPFAHKATITLHGDRWSTVELPFVGAKMLAVTNRGGLTSRCHKHTISRASSFNAEGPQGMCDVQSVGKLDLHGRPDISWTRVDSTANPGDTFIVVAEAVQWPVGSWILITPSTEPAKNAADPDECIEERYVTGLADGGKKVLLDAPLKCEHLGIWYWHDPQKTPTDLRAAVGLLSKNVKIQGDDASGQPGNSYKFGAHTACFFGGEMRIENVEFFRTGQAANLGRYSSHWHNLSPGRNVDVLPVGIKAYNRNNSFHHTFQRAATTHGTDYAVVRDNVAYKVMGHNFFIEAGDEDFVTIEHNLAVKAVSHDTAIVARFRPLAHLTARPPACLPACQASCSCMGA
jgi:hypothetical protein